MPARTFHVVAHRGCSAHAPENTVYAFDAALRAGADEIETDVRVTKDGVAVLCHDASLFRTTAKEAEVKDLTLEELRHLDAGSFRGEKFKSARIPTLDEMLSKYLARIPWELELKAFGAVVPAILVLQKHAEQGAFDRVLLTSFNRELLVAALMLDNRCKVGQLLESHSTTTLAEVKHMGAVAVLPHWEDVQKDLLDEAHRLGLFVRAWGVPDLETAKRVVEAGAGGATFNDPGGLVNHLKETGLRQHDLPLPPVAVTIFLKNAAQDREKEKEREKSNGKPNNQEKSNGKANGHEKPNGKGASPEKPALKTSGRV